MDRRGGHAGKSKMDKQIYHKYIKRIDCEPTLDEKLPFPNSNQEGEELSESTSKRKRPIPFGFSLKQHFQERWLYWIVGFVVFVVTYFIFDAKVNIKQLNFITGENKKEITEIRSDVKTIQEDNHKQDLSIQETKLKLDFIMPKKDLDNKKR
ncbi:MAG: hypothetical protein PHN16_05370 [Candidatus Omnitrophica bacterium]|jgi:hypothetical protein|nr:hypothetical protein [Candidatus Omnitrophota bacterium]